MVMTRPHIIRADTIDLQDQHAPSAQDHSRRPIHTSHIGASRSAPHQNQSLRHAEQSARNELSHSPRLSDESLMTEEHRNGIEIVYDEAEDMIGDAVGASNRQNGRYGRHLGPEGVDLVDEEAEDVLDDDLMDKLSSSPSIDDEDIDFEFVYALHTFAATVEGQANATKGDTMVLLDDSNSYWWLVRVVKDGSIGYLPAEHIETPTERLARLNKHRNIDLSATMLGDNPEKPKNSLKIAMRRRNAKTVTFASPTYFEASDIDYSTEEEPDERDYTEDEEEETNRADVQITREEIQDGDIAVEPLRPRGHREKGLGEDALWEKEDSERSSPDKHRTSEESVDGNGESMVARSRNGTLRNTDSFFRDDTTETKKISLTPNLLRDDSGGNSFPSETKESRGSFELAEKSPSSSDKARRRDRKPGMLSGLFKRKDKKGKMAEDDGEEPEKAFEDTSRLLPQQKVSMGSLQESRTTTKPQAVQRQTGKLQKQPPSESSGKREPQQTSTSQEPAVHGNEIPSPSKDGPGLSIRRVVSPQFSDVAVSTFTSTVDASREIGTSQLQLSKANPGLGPVNSTIDIPSKMNDHTFQEDSPAATLSTSSPQPVVSQLEQFPQQTSANKRTEAGSPMDASVIREPTPTTPPVLMGDTSSQEERSISPLSPQPSSPELVDVCDNKGYDVTTVYSSPNTPSWSGASLRSYLDDEHDIRDLLIIVHDKSNVQPAGPDHPITGSLFKEESKKLKEMSSKLDEYLANWISRKLENQMQK